MKEILEYLERQRQRGLKIHEEMDKLMERGEANTIRKWTGRTTKAMPMEWRQLSTSCMKHSPWSNSFSADWLDRKSSQEQGSYP